MTRPIVACGVALLFVLLTACSGGSTDEPRALTEEESQLLAITRFRLHEQGIVSVRIEWPGAPDATITASLDLKNAVGYGTVTVHEAEGVSAVERYIGWSPTVVATAPRNPTSLSSDGIGQWSTRELTATTGQDLVLALALSLGADRPENALLLRQGSAKFLRHDEVDGVPVTVMTGQRPAGDMQDSKTRYWVDADGNLRRFEARLGDRDATVTVLSAGDGPHDGRADGLRDVAFDVLGLAVPDAD